MKGVNETESARQQKEHRRLLAEREEYELARHERRRERIKFDVYLDTPPQAVQQIVESIISWHQERRSRASR